jgi:hypothetical protein
MAHIMWNLIYGENYMLENRETMQELFTTNTGIWMTANNYCSNDFKLRSIREDYTAIGKSKSYAECLESSGLKLLHQFPTLEAAKNAKTTHPELFI